MPRTMDTEERWRLTLAVAKHYSRGESQKAISQKLDISPATVSRLITSAESEGVLETRPLFRPDLVDSEALAAMESHYFSDSALREAFGKEGRANRLLSARSYEARSFARAAAYRVAELIELSSLVGLAWGRLLASLVEEWPRPRGLAPGGRSTTRFIPLCGDPLFLMNQSEVEYSSSHLAARLSRLYGTREGLPSLSGVPAYVGSTVAGGARLAPGVRTFVERIPGYQQIYGNQKGAGSGSVPLIKSVDAVVTGVGIIAADETEDTADFIRERIAQDPIDMADLEDVIVGDLGGVLIGDSDAMAEHPVMRHWDRGWFGLRRNDLSRISKMARDRGPTGVIIIARGASKAPLLMKAVRQGLVNHLIVDEELGAAIRGGRANKSKRSRGP